MNKADITVVPGVDQYSLMLYTRNAQGEIVEYGRLADGTWQFVQRID